MLGAIQKLTESGFPLSIKKKINEIISRVCLPRSIEIGTEDFPTWDVGENGEKILLPAAYSPSGYTGTLTVCEDDGAGGYTQKTATFTNGVLESVE
jgi:hypothetical protein